MSYGNEKIVCCCLLLRDGSIILVPKGKLPMDVLNHFGKYSPYTNNMAVNDTFFVTTQGQVVTKEQARSLAIRSGQLDETENPDYLTPIDLQQMRKL